MAPAYVPAAGDIVWINFDPQAGHEQAGHRPAVVLSPAAYNAKTSLMHCCPMTTQINLKISANYKQNDSFQTI
jgi:mRNA interferase MazF